MKSPLRFVVTLSLVVSAVLTLLKFYAYISSGSLSVFSDALESIVNVVAGAFATYSVYLASKPKDESHPYGHGKVEFFSIGMEGTMIFSAGIMILIKTVKYFLAPYTIVKLDTAAWLIGITCFVNFMLGMYVKVTGKKNKSITLQGNGTHLLTDAYTSIALIAALLLIHFTGLSWIDPVVSIIMCALILWSGYKLLRNSIRGLMDEADGSVINAVVASLNKSRKTNWIDIHNLRIQQYGSDLHIDCHLTLPFYYNLVEMHNEVKELEASVSRDASVNVECFIHIDPCIEESCRVCSLSDCPERKHAFEKRTNWTVEKLLPNRKHG